MFPMIIRTKALVWICTFCKNLRLKPPKSRQTLCSHCHKSAIFPITNPEYGKAGRPKGETEKVKAIRLEGLKLRDKYNCSYPEIAWRLSMRVERIRQILGPPPPGFDPYDENFVMPTPTKKRRGRKSAA